MNHHAYPTVSISSGFTLVELCTIVLLIGILGIAVFPKLVDTKLFSNRGFSDQLKAAVQYARKSAIAERRNICITFGTSVSITRAVAAGSAAACTQTLIDPSTGAAFSLTPPSGVTVTSTVSPIIFSSLGDANGNATVTLTGSGAQSFAIVGSTGYVQ